MPVRAVPDPAGDAAWSAAADEIAAVGRRLDQRGWVPATAGNLSRRLRDGRIAITRSGSHKGLLDRSDVIEVEADGRPVRRDDRPSNETLLHCQLYAASAATAAVLHAHSVAATVLSMVEPGPALWFEGYELLKLFEATLVDPCDPSEARLPARLCLPIFDNDQDIARLCRAIAPRLDGMAMGYALRGHGVYAWGPSMPAALARLEGLEFLLDCALQQRKLGS